MRAGMKCRTEKNKKETATVSFFSCTAWNWRSEPHHMTSSPRGYPKNYQPEYPSFRFLDREGGWSRGVYTKTKLKSWNIVMPRLFVPGTNVNTPPPLLFFIVTLLGAWCRCLLSRTLVWPDCFDTFGSRNSKQLNRALPQVTTCWSSLF